MIILSCNNINKSYIGELILEEVSFAVDENEKVGLVGLNGAGKTTLFKILIDEISADSGSIYVSNDTKIGYLKQNTFFDSEKSVYNEALSIFADVISLEKRIRDLEVEISEESKNGDSKDLDELMNKYSRLQEEFNEKNGYGYHSEIRGVLKGLGFLEDEFYKPINKLSGGQKSRVLLSKLLLQKPDLLLLDEPTNHLDIEAINWLEKYIKEYKGAAIVISHDRYFLDSTVSKIFELENKKIDIYKGNYTTYMKKRKKNLELAAKNYENQRREIKTEKEKIKQLSLGGKRAIRQSKSRQKMLDKMDILDAPKTEDGRSKIRFEPRVKSGDDVLRVEDLSKSFEDNLLFRDVSFNIYRGDRIGLIGPNGVGKTTLFNIILKKIKEDSGLVDLGHKVNPAYYDQEQTNLNNNKTIVDEIWDENPLFDHYKIRSILARFLFRGDDIFKEISTLSGGEKSRLSLMKLMLSKSNFLLMDEPTNHLDIDSKESLEDALIDYTGTLFVISHDRYFLNKVTDKIFELSGGGLEEYLGNYDYYIEKKYGVKDEDDEAPAKTKTEIKNEQKKERERLREESRKKKEVKDIEVRISDLENQISILEEEMCKEEVFSDPQKSLENLRESEKIKKELEKLYEKWEMLLIDS